MITQRSASARALVIISTIVVVLVLLLATAVHAFSGSAPVDTVEYRVGVGDSLWSIAGDLAPADADVRVMVATIRELNDLSGALIHAGDLLLVPTDT